MGKHKAVYGAVYEIYSTASCERFRCHYLILILKLQHISYLLYLHKKQSKDYIHQNLLQRNYNHRFLIEKIDIVFGFEIYKNHDNHDEETSQEEIPKAHDGDTEIEKKTPKPKDENIPDNIIEFTDTSNDEVIATAEYTNDPKRITNITNIKVNNKNYHNFAITKLDINDKYDVDQYENIIDDFILPVICNKLADVTNIDDDKELKIYIKLDDTIYADHIKKLRKLSLAKKIRLKESINNIFIIIGRKSSDMIATSQELKTKQKETNSNETQLTNESLDVDNLFWMLDTWFANNEQEKTTFMSLIDNCIIKKTYNKNDLAKLCDNINFDIRPFINFMCKDAVIKDNEREDDNIDYYYELKKIIDALMSNKATNNKYVRFS